MGILDSNYRVQGLSDIFELRRLSQRFIQLHELARQFLSFFNPDLLNRKYREGYASDVMVTPTLRLPPF